MSTLAIKNRSECRWDAAALGEIMLRFDPGEGRIRTARQFTLWEGGGEYNVIRALRKCFGMNTTVVTAIPENDLGYLLQDFIWQGGVDTSHVQWFPYDGMGRMHRQGLNFVERGFGIRGALSVSDRAHTAAAALKPGDIEWNRIFSEEGCRWFHCGGIFAGLSDTTPEVILEAMKTAKENGTVISYDLNFRPSLWKAKGGRQRAIEVNRKIAPFVDVMIGNEEDFIAALGFSIAGVTPEAYKEMITEVANEFPNLSAIATTLREVKTATINDWQAVLWYDGALYQSARWADLEILDRIGGGDSFASGLIYGFLVGKPPEECVAYGAAHGALAMTTPGDTSMASLAEVEKIVQGGSARVDR